MFDPLTLQGLGEFIFQQLSIQEEGGLAFNWIDVLDTTLQEMEWQKSLEPSKSSCSSNKHS